MLAQEFLTLFVLSNFYKFCDVRIQKAGFRRVGVVERGRICMKSLGRCKLCKLNLGFCGHLRVVILEANYLNPSFCRVYYWWLGGFGMLIGAREGVARVLAVACELIAVACKSMPVACRGI